MTEIESVSVVAFPSMASTPRVVPFCSSCFWFLLPYFHPRFGGGCGEEQRNMPGSLATMVAGERF